METFENAKNNAIDGKIYCHCIYEYKDSIKQLGFKWNAYLKLWYIPAIKFTQDLYDKAKEATKFESHWPASGRWGATKGHKSKNFGILYKSTERLTD
jgi:hypothetical protein